MNYRNLLSLVLTVFIVQATAAQNLSDLNWMAGYWTSSENGAAMEELWTESSGGMLIGIHRDVFGNGGSSFEYLRIVNSEDGIVYLASPGGRPATPFTLTELKDQKVVFENLENDFPQRIIYSREGDELTARIEDQSGEKGMQWTWTKTQFE